MFCYKYMKQKSDMTLICLPLSNLSEIMGNFLLAVLVFKATEDLILKYSGADFTKGLKPGFGLKFKTLVLNSVKNVLSQRA